MTIVSKLFYAVFVLLLLGVAGLFLASLLPIPGNVQIKIVKSGSMEPAILTGSVVVLKPQSTYAVGDVITFGEGTGAQIPTTHRIVEIQTEGSQVFYKTKGDANEEADGVRIAAQDVEGRVLFSIPYAGYVLDFAKKPLGFTLMIAIPAAIIIVDEVIRIGREVTALRRRKDPGTPPNRSTPTLDLRQP
ncbi:MAG: signal peptidase, endoplasmic reticulum-type [Parcubacteria group bacterium Gr01-1014_8]|nr:MAG: signal peptidase, endoplasmic reticulum-type [Parcubacteria group bacterium Gr01-1014_8]